MSSFAEGGCTKTNAILSQQTSGDDAAEWREQSVEILFRCGWSDASNPKVAAHFAYVQSDTVATDTLGVKYQSLR